MPASRIVRVLGVVLSVVAVAGCADSNPVSPSASGQEPISSAASSFGSVDGYPTWASTDDALVGFAGFDLEHPEIEPRYGYLSLSGTDTRALPAPPSERTVVPVAIGGLADSAVLVVEECDRPPSSAEPDCGSAQLAVFELQVGEADPWERLVLPAALEGSPVGAVAAMQPHDSGLRVAGVGRGGSPGVVFDVSGETVTDLDIAPPAARQHCFSGDDLYSLHAPPADDVTADVPPTLLRTRAGSEPSTVELPAVSPADGAITVRIACDANSVFVTSSGAPTAEPAPTVWQLEDSQWVPRDDLAPDDALIALQSLSSDAGVAFDWSRADGGGAVVTSPTGGQAQTHDDASGGVLAWKGLTSKVLVMSSPDEENHVAGQVVEVEL